MCYPNGYSSSKEKGLRLMLELKYICNYTHYRSLSLMHKCSSPLVQEHICSPHLRLHFPLSLYLGNQAPSALWFPYLFRDLPDHCGSWSLWNKGWVFLSVWFREEADYYQSMSLPHVFIPSRTRSCRSMWLCFREPQIRAITDITLSFHHFLAGNCCPPQTGPIPLPESWFFSGNMGEESLNPG